MTYEIDLKKAASLIHAFMREHETSDVIAGYAACPECFTIFAGFRVHADDCGIGRAADAARMLCEALGGDLVIGARALVVETGEQT